MTALLDSHAISVEKILAAWLAPLRRSGVAFRVGDSLPFTLITKIGGTDCPNIQTAEPLVSVHTLCDKMLGYQAADDEADATERAMNYLARWPGPLTLLDDTSAAIDYLEPFQSRSLVDYEDVTILRWVARYRVGLSYVPAPTWTDGS